ncbi:hypothetical protein NDU88_010652 [Pleurodeles waltl]|uniref:Uncharacterized protein n=1 Tax=Pleurodeles waltl TaxID=8319 RepID=A0AAV7Q0S8_PLEWA|nr:hypothetical protein NDU88_010652 [Pleurodeles waltl]
MFSPPAASHLLLSQGASGSTSRAGGRLATGRRPHLLFRSAPLLRGGPVSRASAGRSAPPKPGAAAATRRRPTRAQARTRAHEPAGGRPRGRGRTQAAPVTPAPHPRRFNTGSPPAQRASALPAGRAAASPQPRAAPVTRGPAPGGGRDRTSAVPPSTAVVPLHSGHRTARISASRHRFKVGPSGADQLSVRHARLRGHAPRLLL